jgi:pimeloyl-ACP methyl ester carboxylesterase
MAMTSHYVLGLGPHGFHRIHYTAWGDPDNPRVLICVHGLTRNARDFDFFAAALADAYRIICVDVPGRGRSDWFTHKEDYSYPVYLAGMTAVLARTGAEQVDWVGTSMGGLIGMSLAAQPGSPIRRLVMNDVGPFIPKAAVERIATYVGKPLQFADLAELERYFRVIAAPFGPATDAQWHHMAVHSSRRQEDGRYVFAYDPGIAEAFKTTLDDVDLWAIWDTVRCPVLVLRGVDSDVLTRADAEAMTQRGPRTQRVEFAGVGHAPGLMTDEQIATVRDWLLAA